jgi:hypothetical protein
MSSNKAGLFSLFLLLLVSVLMLPSHTSVVTASLAQNQRASVNLDPSPPGLSAKIKWPLLSHPAIMLNGSTFEARIKGPSNVTGGGWSFSLYR